jgi:biopolymer transport protein ExbD
MGKHKMPPVKEDISPNVVPMIDIMFLLLLFFMLGADMSQRESVEVKLPVADQIKEDKDKNLQQDPETTVNISPDPSVNEAVFKDLGTSRDAKNWVVSIRGNQYTIDQLKTQLKIEGDEFPEAGVDAQAGRVLSKKKVLIRAERTAPFGLVQKVIETAGSVGMYKVEVAGSKPPATGKSKPGS